MNKVIFSATQIARGIVPAPFVCEYLLQMRSDSWIVFPVSAGTCSDSHWWPTGHCLCVLLDFINWRGIISAGSRRRHTHRLFMPLLWYKVLFHQKNQELLVLQSTSRPVTKRFHCCPSSPLVKKLPTIKIKHREHSTNENSLTLPVLESSWSLGKYHPLSRDYPRTEFRPCGGNLSPSKGVPGFLCKVIKSPLFSTICCENLFSVWKKND